MTHHDISLLETTGRTPAVNTKFKAGIEMENWLPENKAQQFLISQHLLAQRPNYLLIWV